MASKWLRGYTWDEAASRYRSDRTGRFVAREKIIRLLDRSINGREERLAAGTRAVLEGKITPAVWEARSAVLIQRQYMQNAALAAGGWDRLTPVDLQRLSEHLSDSFEHLAKFAQDIADGKVSEAQALSRLHMYVGDARKEFYTIDKERRQASVPAGETLEARRTLAPVENCDDCIVYAGMGWVSAEQLPVPGEGSRCMGNCRCSIDYRVKSRVSEYDPSQPRDEKGRFSSGMGVGSAFGKMSDAGLSLGDAISADERGFDTFGKITGLTSYEDTPRAKQQAQDDIAAMLKDDPDFKVLAKGMGYDNESEAAGALIHQWAESSGDSHPRSIAMQEAIEREFGLDTPEWSSWTKDGIASLHDDPTNNYLVTPEAQRGMDHFVRAMYTNTQQRLDAAGADDYIWGWRGMSMPRSFGTGVLDTVVKMQPASSFSLDYGTANEFASISRVSDVSAVMGAWIPKTRILSMPGTGFGCLSELEMVVLGGGDTSAIVVTGPGRFVSKKWFDDVARAR